MDFIELQLKRLKDPEARIRLDACAQLRRDGSLPTQAIKALKAALEDPDDRVAGAAREVLRAEGAMPEPDPRGERLSQAPARTQSWVGNLHAAHILFLVMGFFIFLMMAMNGGWMASFFVLLFMAAVIFSFGAVQRSGHEKLTQTWSELARETGLQLNAGHSYFFGMSWPPSVGGVYRGRGVSVSKMVVQQGSYEGTIPVVYTQIRLELDNRGDCQLGMKERNILQRVFRKRASSESEELDRQFSFRGFPTSFVEDARRLISRHAGLLEKPDGVIMRTDYPLSWVSWSRLSILLDGSGLIWMQSGVPTQIPGQVSILNLLCDLAELAEAEGGIERP